MPEARRGHPIMAGHELRSACAKGRQRRWTQASGSRPTLRSDCRDLRGVPGALPRRVHADLRRRPWQLPWCTAQRL